jgi:connector enhancer of kinase suppressor of Ras 2
VKQIQQFNNDNNTIERPRKKSTSMEIKEETELVTPAKVKTLTNRKKNSLMAKRRKVTLKSLGTSSTIQGHLYKRAKDRSEVAYWVKLYFVLIETALYGFKSKESQKADCVIFLSGITVSLAKEVHSKQFAFKVYHPKKSFWFAAETKEALNQWMEFLEKAAMKGSINLECEPRDLYSETECSEDEDVLTPKQFSTPSPLKIENSSKHSFNTGSLKKIRASPNNGESSSPSEHKFFGFFNLKTTEKKTADIIPTNNFKTYKKVKESNGGMQLGSTQMSNVDMNTYLQSGITIDMRAKKHEEYPQHERIEMLPEYPQRVKEEQKPMKKSATPNYLRASNPNLLDFSFKPPLDFPIPTYSSGCTWDPSTDVHVTLLDLMQQQLDEEKRDMYNKRVEQGIEKIYDKTLTKPKIPPKPVKTDPFIEKIQKRSLPTRPDDKESFNLYDKELLFTRTREGQKLRDFGYELISNGDDSSGGTVDVVKYSTEKNTKPRGDRIAPTNSLKKKSGFTHWIISSDKDDCSSTSSGSFRKSKKNENLKISNEKASKSQNNVFASSLNSERFLQPPPTSSKVLRKNSAPSNGGNVLGINYFSKLTFTSSSCKEKKILGSPKLHRAIFGSSKAQSPTSPNSDHEIFTPITFAINPVN